MFFIIILKLLLFSNLNLFKLAKRVAFLFFILVVTFWALGFQTVHAGSAFPVILTEDDATSFVNHCEDIRKGAT